MAKKSILERIEDKMESGLTAVNEEFNENCEEAEGVVGEEFKEEYAGDFKLIKFSLLAYGVYGLVLSIINIVLFAASVSLAAAPLGLVGLLIPIYAIYTGVMAGKFKTKVFVATQLIFVIHVLGIMKTDSAHFTPLFIVEAAITTIVLGVATFVSVRLRKKIKQAKVTRPDHN